jgi:hypothetical protein
VAPKRLPSGDYEKPGWWLRILRSGAFYWSAFGVVVVIVLLLMTQLR